jgi:hypothetical protein
MKKAIWLQAARDIIVAKPTQYVIVAEFMFSDQSINSPSTNFAAKVDVPRAISICAIITRRLSSAASGVPDIPDTLPVIAIT